MSFAERLSACSDILEVAVLVEVHLFRFFQDLDLRMLARFFHESLGDHDLLDVGSVLDADDFSLGFYVDPGADVDSGLDRFSLSLLSTIGTLTTLKRPWTSRPLG